MQHPGITYPLTSDLALISFGLECVVAGLCFKWFLQAFFKWKNSETRIRESRDLGWAVFFLGFGLFYICIIFRDFRISDETIRHYLVLWGFVFLSLMNTISMYIFERQIRSTRILPLSFTCFALCIPTAIGAILSNDLIVFISVGTGAVVLVGYFVYYANTLLKLVNWSRSIIRRLTFMFFFGVAAVGGFATTVDLLWAELGIWSRIVGDLLIIGAINMFIYQVDYIPDFREVDWMNKIKALLVINENGLPLFARFFNQKEEENLNVIDGLKKGFLTHTKADNQQIVTNSMDPEYDQTLISGAMNSVKSVLGELTGTDEVQIIKLPDKVLIFENINGRMFLIISDAYMDSLKIRLEQFATEFERIFGDTLKNWDGGADIFGPADTMTAEIFSW